MKLLLPFKDKNGKTCDTQKSYVTLTKKENEYEMKVNLKCSEEEDKLNVLEKNFFETLRKITAFKKDQF